MCVSSALERLVSNSPFRPSFSMRNTTFEWSRPDLFVRANKSWVLVPVYRDARVFMRNKWNTYGDPPNSDLLRRYGHVDQVPLANGGLGNPADIVEIRADLVVATVEQRISQQSSPWSSERVSWWLEEGGDECITLFTCRSQFSDLPLQCLRCGLFK